MTTLSVFLLCTIPIAGMAQQTDAFGLKGKLRLHAESVYSPWSMAGSAAYAGILQEVGAPEEWGEGAGAYGKRFASTVGGSGIQAALAFGLDSTLRQDPRYFRSRSTGFWRRATHAFRGTILTRTDHGGETLSTWRLRSADGDAFLSNQVAGPAEYKASGCLAGIPPTRVRFRQQSQRGVPAGSQTEDLHRRASLAPDDLHSKGSDESAH